MTPIERENNLASWAARKLAPDEIEGHRRAIMAHASALMWAGAEETLSATVMSLATNMGLYEAPTQAVECCIDWAKFADETGYRGYGVR